LRELYNRIQAGAVFIDDINSYGGRLLPFGGYKQSGFGGRCGSKWHLEAMTRTKSLMMYRTD